LLILDKDSEIVLLIGLRVAQANPPAVLMVSTYKFEIAGAKLTEIALTVKEEDLIHRVLVFHPPVQRVEANYDVFGSELDAFELGHILMSHNLFRRDLS